MGVAGHRVSKLQHCRFIAQTMNGVLLLQLCSLLNGCYLLVSGTYNPGIRLRISRAGLDYLNAIAERMLNHLIETTEVPPMRLNFTLWLGRGDFTVYNVSVLSLITPHYDYELVPGYGIKWNARNGSLDFKGDWSAKYSILLTAKAAGSLKVSAGGIGWSVFFAIRRGLNSRPKIKLFTCDVEIDRFELQFGSGIIPYAMNYFKDTIARAVKAVVQNQMCQHAETVLLQMLNDRIGTIPVSLPINHFFSLNYGLVEDVMIDHSHVDCAIDGRLSLIDGPKTDLFCDPLDHIGAGEETMLNMVVSDCPLNSLLHSAHAQGMLEYTTSTSEQPEIEAFLKTKCLEADDKDEPLGHVAAGSYYNLSVQIASHAAPEVKFTKDFVLLRGLLNVSVSKEVNAKTNATRLLSFDLDFNSAITPKATDDVIRGRTERTDVVVLNMYSSLSPLTQNDSNMVSSLSQKYISQSLNRLLASGFRTPVVYNFTVINSTAVLADDAMFLFADLKFVPSD